jgi:hypothetical protein
MQVGPPTLCTTRNSRMCMAHFWHWCGVFILLVSLFLFLPVFLLFICPIPFSLFPLPFFVSLARIHFSKFVSCPSLSYSVFALFCSLFLFDLPSSFLFICTFVSCLSFFVIHNFVLFPILLYIFVSRFTPFLFFPLSFLFHSLCRPRLSLIFESNTLV